MQPSDGDLSIPQSNAEVSIKDGTCERGPSIYFDGSCALCSAEIDHYASREGACSLSFVDVSENDTDLGADLTSGQAMVRFHIRRSDGSLVSGARAFVEVWDALPGWRWLARLAKFRGVLPVLEVAYRAFLPIRPVLSRLVARFQSAPSSAQHHKR